MPFFIPLIAVAGGFVVRRWVWIAGVGLVATYYDEAGEVIGDAIGDEANKVMEEALDDAKILIKNSAGDVSNATLDVVRGLGSAIIVGLDGAFDAVAEKLAGKEPAVIAGITTATIGLLTVILLFHTAKKGL